jgi:hypothetical protein
MLQAVGGEGGLGVRSNGAPHGGAAISAAPSATTGPVQCDLCCRHPATVWSRLGAAQLAGARRCQTSPVLAVAHGDVEAQGRHDRAGICLMQ